jgi:hypothetical protein
MLLRGSLAKLLSQLHASPTAGAQLSPASPAPRRDFPCWVGREQVVHALARQRVDDEEVRGSRRRLGRLVADAG